MWQTFLQPTSLSEALDLLTRYGSEARLIAGGTDVLVELQRGVKPTSTLIDVSTVPDLKYVRLDGAYLTIGALATHNTILQSPLSWQHALPLAQACQQVGAPQIRTRATVAGNLLTASPANDTIPPLLALDAELVLASSQGERVVPISQFYQGVRRTVRRADELLREIRLPLAQMERRGLFLKLGLRHAQAISVVNLALLLSLTDGVVREVRVVPGCVAPVVTRAEHVEAFLLGKYLEPEICRQAAELIAQDCAPISDVRASAAYRLITLTNLLEHGLKLLHAAPATTTAHPVLLETAAPPGRWLAGPRDDSIQTTINGQGSRFAPHTRQKTLLNLLREDAGLIGCKEGCAEGECGACTVWLNGQAVMSCLVPAPQIHGATITTIEGLGTGEQLHPLQQAFIDCAAVQCGFCIPGMLMAGAKLLEESPHPDMAQMRTALSGNICRCTGYSKILDALAQVGGTL